MLVVVCSLELETIRSKFRRYPVKGVLCKKNKDGSFTNIISKKKYFAANVAYAIPVIDKAPYL